MRSANRDHKFRYCPPYPGFFPLYIASPYVKVVCETQKMGWRILSESGVSTFLWLSLSSWKRRAYE